MTQPTFFIVILNTDLIYFTGNELSEATQMATEGQGQGKKINNKNVSEKILAGFFSK